MPVLLPSVASCLDAAHAPGLERLERQMLLLHALGQSPHARAWLLAHDEQTLTNAQWHSYQALLARRLQGEPMGYLLGRQAFYGLELAVDARVLVPRPDTETLVDWALEVLAGRTLPRAIDLGTGSGAIALALQSLRPDLQMQAVDASSDALAVARANALRLQLPVQFHQGDWLAESAGSFDLIASNPPYIAAADTHLAALAHEPLQALASGADGLDAIRAIVPQATRHLLPGGWLLLEHGYDQAQRVCALLGQAGFSQVQSRRDLAGIARCSGGQWG